MKSVATFPYSFTEKASGLFFRASELLKVEYNNKKKQRENRQRSELMQHESAAGQVYKSITTEKLFLFKLNTVINPEIIVLGFPEQ